MNPEQFILMMNALPDSVIDSANAPYVKKNRKIWQIIPAAAACFVALIAAAVYPKLRAEKPPITEPAVQITETTAVTGSALQSILPTTALTTRTTAKPVSTVSTLETESTEDSSETITEPISDLPVSDETEPPILTDITDLPTTQPTVLTTTEQPAESTVTTTRGVAVGTTTANTPHISAGEFSVPVYRIDHDTPTSVLEPKPLTCHVSEPTEATLQGFDNIAPGLADSEQKLLHVQITGDCQNALITSGQLIEGQLYLTFCYFNGDAQIPQNVSISYLLAFPADTTIQTDDITVFAEQITDADAFRQMLEARLQSIMISYERSALL